MVSSTRATESAILALTTLKNLTSLEIVFSEFVHSDDFKEVLIPGSLSSLQTLKVTSKRSQKSYLTALALACPNLKSLQFKSRQFFFREVFTQFKKPNLKPNSNSDSIDCEEYFFEINKI